MTSPPLMTAADAARWIAVPTAASHKYTRGVLGVVTGSSPYPGAAVLGVEAALRTGVGMLRYLGDARPSDLVLQRRPETVTVPGRVQAWLLGSGMGPAAERDGAAHDRLALAVDSGCPLVLDAGALDLVDAGSAPRVLTPHAGELAALLGASRAEVEQHPLASARAAAERHGATVLLKGSTSIAVEPGGRARAARSAPAWLATAGAGDALAGILGALVATHAEQVRAEPAVLVDLAAAAAVLHGLAAEAASAGGPFTVLDLCAQLGPTIARLLREHPAP